MYIQITTRCNMRCAHCCYSCGPRTGEHMSIETFRACLADIDSEDYITLGGGEPTVHPHFEKILLLAIAHVPNGGVHVITNGKHSERAMMLLGLAKAGAISAELSIDEYHERIDPDVEDAWKEEAYNVRLCRMMRHETRSNVGIRNTTENHEPFPHGRAVTLLGYSKENSANDICPCDGPIMKPNGDVMLCGCDNAPKIGDVIGGYSIPDMEDEHCTRFLSREAKA